jgi:hypothetical protein
MTKREALKLCRGLARHASHSSSCTYWIPPNNRPGNWSDDSVCSCGLATLLLQFQAEADKVAV